MNTVVLILGMAAGVYGLRIAGLSLRDTAVPPQWEQALRFVPIALISALVMLSLTGPANGEPRHLAAAAGAALVAYRTRRMWACIASGMALYWLLGLV